MNRGEIEAEFRLVPSTSAFGRKFSFEPSAGVLSVGQTQLVGRCRLILGGPALVSAIEAVI